MEPDGQQQGPRAPPGVTYTHCWCQTLGPVGAFTLCVEAALSSSSWLVWVCLCSVCLLYVSYCNVITTEDCLFHAVLYSVASPILNPVLCINLNPNTYTLLLLSHSVMVRFLVFLPCPLFHPILSSVLSHQVESIRPFQLTFTNFRLLQSAHLFFHC